MSASNHAKALQGVVDSARIWKRLRDLGTSGAMAEASLLSALEDLEHVERTGEFPPGKWESMDVREGL